MTHRNYNLTPILRYGRIPISGLPGTGTRYAPSWSLWRVLAVVACLGASVWFVGAVLDAICLEAEIEAGERR